MISQELKDALRGVDDATTRLGTSVTNVSAGVDAVSTRVDALVKQLGDTPTPQEVADFKADVDKETTRLDDLSVALDQVADTLNKVGRDPANPVPPLPEPVPTPEPPVV